MKLETLDIGKPAPNGCTAVATASAAATGTCTWDVTMGSWSCPHELRNRCMKVAGRACSPGMKGCVLYGRFVFSREEENSPTALKPTHRRSDGSRIDD